MTTSTVPCEKCGGPMFERTFVIDLVEYAGYVIDWKQVPRTVHRYAEKIIHKCMDDMKHQREAWGAFSDDKRELG